jgi:Vanillate O-demethylase oxygenase C-terminal domain
MRAFTEEDQPMIHACQELMGTVDLFSLKPAILKTDTAAVKARRMLAKMLEQKESALTLAAE